MSVTNRHKYKYFHSTVQRAKDRRQKFHFCRLPFDVRPRNVKLNLSIINKSSGFSRKLLSSKLTKRWSVWCFSNCHQKEQLFAFPDSIQTEIVIQSCEKVGLIPSNTQGFPVSQRLSTSLPYAGDRSLYRRAFQDNLSSILH